MKILNNRLRSNFNNLNSSHKFILEEEGYACEGPEEFFVESIGRLYKKSIDNDSFVKKENGKYGSESDLSIDQMEDLLMRSKFMFKRRVTNVLLCKFKQEMDDRLPWHYGTVAPVIDDIFGGYEKGEFKSKRFIIDEAKDLCKLILGLI